LWAHARDAPKFQPDANQSSARIEADLMPTTGVLVVNRKLRVANNVDEQDMGDLELDLLFNFSGHARKLFRRERGDDLLKAWVAA
jgi:hypothetical protein